MTAAVRSKRAGALAAVVLTSSLLQGCGGGDEPAAKSEARITIQNFAFVPKELTVTPGQKITVVNADRAPHTVTAMDGSFDSGELAQGESMSFTAPDAGEHTYICDLHQYMTGRVVVR